MSSNEAEEKLSLHFARAFSYDACVSNILQNNILGVDQYAQTFQKSNGVAFGNDSAGVPGDVYARLCGDKQYDIQQQQLVL